MSRLSRPEMELRFEQPRGTVGVGSAGRYGKFMKRLGLLLVLLCSLDAARPVAAQSSTDPRADARYKVFSERNPFGLKDPPPPAPTKPVVPPVTYVTYLTGIGVSNPRLPANAPDRLIAHFQRREPNKKSVEFSLKPGQAKDGLEVIAIEPSQVAKSTRVRVLENGVEGVYTFALNGVPQPRGGAVPTPGQPASLPGMPALRGAIPTGMPSAQTVLPSATGPGIVMNPATGQVTPASTIATSPMVRTANERAPAAISIPQPNVAMQYSTVAGGKPTVSTIPAPPATPSATPGVTVISGTYQDPQHPQSGMNSQQQQYLMEVNRISTPNSPPTPGIPLPNLPGSGAQ